MAQKEMDKVWKRMLIMARWLVRNIGSKGLWLIVYKDDSSRFIVGYGVYPTPTSKYSVDVLMKAINMYGKPEEILSDHGTTFYGVESDEREKGFLKSSW